MATICGTWSLIYFLHREAVCDGAAAYAYPPPPHPALPALPAPTGGEREREQEREQERVRACAEKYINMRRCSINEYKNKLIQANLEVKE
jgi:hypothetical protein